VRFLSIALIVLGIAVLIIGILELRTGLQIQSLGDAIGRENIHLPEDIQFVKLADKLVEIQNYKIIQSITVSALCFIAGFNFWRLRRND
jgi:hypothetical protein